MESGAGRPGGRSTFVVLSGGASRRMGRDKAFLRVGGREMLDGLLEVGRSVCDACVVVADDAPRYAEALVRWGWKEIPTDRARGGADVPASAPASDRTGEARRRSEGPAAGSAGGEPPSGRTPRRFRRGDADLRLTTDRRPGLGPVAGLEAGLAAAPGPLCFAAACDLPFLRPAVVAALLRELDAGVADPRAVVPVAGGRRQPLAAGYTASAARAARRCVDGGELRMDDLLRRLAVRTPAADELVPDGPGTARRAFTNVNRPEDLRRARRVAATGDEARPPERPSTDPSSHPDRDGP